MQMIIYDLTKTILNYGFYCNSHFRNILIKKDHASLEQKNIDSFPIGLVTHK